MPEILQGTVDVPGVGKTKKAFVIIPAGIAGVYVAYRWYQASKVDTGPATSDGTYTTPDQTEMGLSTSGGAYNPTGNTGAVQTDGTNPNALNTNADWTAKVVESLSGAGYDRGAVYAALGEFLAKRALNKDEATIVRAAIAAAGQPPIGGPYSVIEEATTGGTGTLPAPKNLRAWGSNSSTTVGMQWDPVPGAAHYRIFRNLGENVGDSIDTKFSARGLEPLHTYKFSVAAVSSSGKTGPQSSEVTLKTTGAKLKAPTGLRATSTTRTTVTLSWNSVSGAQDGYRAYRSGVGTNVGASRDTHITVGGLKPNTSYKFKVAGVAGGTTGPGSSWVTARTKR